MIYSCWYKVEMQIPDRPGSENAGDWYDITDNIKNGVTLEETADMLDRLSFQLVSSPDVSVMRFVDSFTEGIKVRAWFGYMDGRKILNSTNEMFIGFTDRALSDFGKNGVVTLDVTAYDAAWLLTRKEPASQHTYPQGKGSMTPKDIISLIVAKYSPHLKVGRIELPAKYADMKFTSRNPIIQKENDWKFLKRLAFGDETARGANLVKKHEVYKGLDSIVYVEQKDGDSYLNFVSADKRLEETSDLTLVYPLADMDIPTSNDPTATEGTQLIERVRIDDDRDIGDDTESTITVPADAFGDVLDANEIKSLNESGGAKVTVAEFFDSFEIDYDKIERDEKAGRLTWGFLDFAAGKIGWEDIKQYVRIKVVYAPAPKRSLPADIPITPEEMKDPVKQRQFIEKKLDKKKKTRKGVGFHMTVSMMAGNVNIRPRQVYRLEGLGGKYSSSDKQRWFADTVTHFISSAYRQDIKVTQ